MSNKKHPIFLNQTDYEKIYNIIKSLKTSEKIKLRAKLLLELNESGREIVDTDVSIADTYNVSRMLIRTIRKTYDEQGIDAVLERKKRDVQPVKITKDVKNKIFALNKTTAPFNRKSWSLRMLADRAVELNYIDSISHEAVSRILKKEQPNN